MQQNDNNAFYHSNSQPQLHGEELQNHQKVNKRTTAGGGYGGNFVANSNEHHQQQQPAGAEEFQHDLGLINQLVVGQQMDKKSGQAQHRLKMDRVGQRIPSAASSTISSSGGTEELDMDDGEHSPPSSRRTSPGALINNLLARNGAGAVSHLQHQNSTNVNSGRTVGGVATQPQITQQQQQHQVVNGTLLQGIDFAANVSQLANYAGHFPDQLDMSNLFGSAAISSNNLAVSPFANYHSHPQQQQDTASAVSTSNSLNSAGTNGPATSSAGSNGGGRRHRSSAGSNSLKCPFCPKKVVGGQASLQAHLEDCRLIRVHECAQCGKRFKARGGLQQHNKIHINERPYHCHYCPKQFTQKSHVDQHERIHTGQKPFTCQYCGRQFRQRSQQLGHEATHMNRERHANASMSAAMLGGLVSASGGYDNAMAQRVQQRQVVTSTHQNSISPEQHPDSPSRSSAAVDLVSRTTTVSDGHMANVHHQIQRQLHTNASGGGGNNHSMTTPMMAIAQQHQQQMASSFDGLLRAVQSTDSAAVDGLLGLRSSMSSMKQHQQLHQQQQQHPIGMELNEQLQLAVSAHLMNN